MKLKIKVFLKRIIPKKIQKTSMFKMVARYKYTAVATVALLICLSIVMTTIAFGTADDNYLAADNSSTIASSEISSLVSEESSSSEAESEISSEESSSSKKNTTSSKKSGTSKKPAKTSSKNSTISVSKPALKGDYKYNTNLNIEDNVFMDSLIYTGYNMKKHRADGKMWQYVLAKYKRGYGWLSDITYAGGSTGLETKNGKPDIGYFERNGLVCASFATAGRSIFRPHLSQKSFLRTNGILFYLPATFFKLRCYLLL